MSDEVQWLPTHAGGINGLVAWHDTNGSHLASAGTDGTVRIFDTETGIPEGQPLAGHNGHLYGVLYWPHADGTRLISAGTDAQIIIWNANDGSIVARFDTRPVGVRSMDIWLDR